MSLMDFMVSLPAVAEVYPTSEIGTPMRHGYVVPMIWMVIYEYGVPEGALNLNSTTTQTMVTMGILPFQGKNPHDRARY
jgi:hypothetical protein